MKVWIDKQGGTHYHKEFCRMITPQYHYEPVEVSDTIIQHLSDVRIDKQLYYPCPLCYRDKRK